MTFSLLHLLVLHLQNPIPTPPPPANMSMASTFKPADQISHLNATVVRHCCFPEYKRTPLTTGQDRSAAKIPRPAFRSCAHKSQLCRLSHKLAFVILKEIMIYPVASVRREKFTLMLDKCSCPCVFQQTIDLIFNLGYTINAHAINAHENTLVFRNPDYLI